MIDIDKAQRFVFTPTLSGHPFRVIGNNEFLGTVREFSKSNADLESAKPKLESLFPDLDSGAVYDVFCNSVYLARHELSLSA